MNILDIEDKITDYTYTHTYSFENRVTGEPISGSYEVTTDWHEMWGGFDPFDVPDVGTVEHVESFGGEGEGDTAWVVIRVRDHEGTERLFRKDGWYQSFNGAEFDGDFREVRATEKTITVYEESVRG